MEITLLTYHGDGLHGREGGREGGIEGGREGGREGRDYDTLNILPCPPTISQSLLLSTL